MAKTAMRCALRDVLTLASWITSRRSRRTAPRQWFLAERMVPGAEVIVTGMSHGSFTRVRRGGMRESWCGSASSAERRFATSSRVIKNMVAGWRCGSLPRPRPSIYPSCSVLAGCAVKSTFLQCSEDSPTPLLKEQVQRTWRFAAWSMSRSTRGHHTRQSARSQPRFADRRSSGCGRWHRTVPAVQEDLWRL
jgi:hypothetical protein